MTGIVSLVADRRARLKTDPTHSIILIFGEQHEFDTETEYCPLHRR